MVGSYRKFMVTLSGGARHAATLVGAFRANDLAVIRVQGASPRPARFADSSKIAVGDFALAIGNPLGLRSSVSDGIVSSLGRTVNAGDEVVLPSVIQTSAPINPGNSGGALVDLSGRMIGIPTLAALVPELGGSQAPGGRSEWTRRQDGDPAGRHHPGHRRRSDPTADVLVSVLATLRPGQRVSVKILRDQGRRVTVTVALGELRGG